MAYVEAGKGEPVVFVHGNPTSSYLWRKVIPEVAGVGRCIALDLIGMGDSAKIASGPTAYRFADHRQYLDGFLEVMGIDRDVTLVGHDWGGPLAFDWGRRNPEAVRAVAYMETLVTPIGWDDWPERGVRMFQRMRSDEGEQLVLDENIFVERILPASVLRPLSAETMAEYRRPFAERGEVRRPTLTWPREIPIDGEPADVAEILTLNQEWLASDAVPKLFVNADPGSIMTDRIREVCRSFANQVEVTVPGVHFIQEDSGEAIGKAIADFLRRL